MPVRVARMKHDLPAAAVRLLATCRVTTHERPAPLPKSTAARYAKQPDRPKRKGRGSDIYALSPRK